MKLVKFIEFINHKKKSMLMISYIVLALIVIVDAIPLIVNKEHAHTQIESLPGFWALFGFIACGVIIFFSKWYGHAGIMKPEDYYDD